ncbi:eukaryotic translation initiation factor 4E-like isoform X2 [Artemia franciscana]|uniref:eukaryotic translation initiation factor 4E-like isoform X2 n=1 Tax=Artemia franciscana TaxID=6661 RepID=UPI0032D9F900
MRMKPAIMPSIMPYGLVVWNFLIHILVYDQVMATLDPVSVHDDSNLDPELPMAHPLQNKWTFWYYKPSSDKSVQWEQNLHKVTDFDTVEGFWGLHNHIKPPSELKQGYDFNFFKKGIMPMWEDPSNIKGDKWVLTLDKGRRGPENDKKLWLELVWII